MKIFITVILFTLIFIFSTGFLSNRNIESTPSETAFSFSSEKEMVVGEEIVYVVKYYLLKLGELRFKVVSKGKANGKNVYNAIVYMDSYNGVPMVDLHQTYETKLNSDYYSEYFRGIVKGKDYSSFTDYYFNYPKKNVHVKKGKVSPYQIWNDTNGVVNKMLQDGLSIFYFARMNTGRKHSVDVPCMVNEKQVNTHINFYDQPQKTRIESVNYDISSVYVDGRTDFVSVFGLTGFFDGWFTNDAAGIPLKANLNVLIGKASVELISWKRPGWNPPKYN